MEPLKFHEFYPELLNYIMFNGHEEANVRTGKNLKGLPGISFTLSDLLCGQLPTDGLRKQFAGTAAAEIAWFLSGSSSVADLHDLGCHIWDKFVTPGTNQVECAYGFRWRKYFGDSDYTRDQIALARQTLANDPSSRQVVVSAWDPEFDGLGAKGLNFPCPVMFTFNMLGGKLNSTMLLRSSDVFVGLPYDVMGHALLTSLMANSLECKPGLLTFTLAHAHVYDVHWAMAIEGLDIRRKARSGLVSRLPLPAGIWDIDTVVTEPKTFVQGYRTVGAFQPWPDFAPKPEVVQ